MNQETKIRKAKTLLAIENARQRLENAIRTDNNKLLDEVWAQLIQLYAALYDLEVDEYLRRGA